MPTGADAVRNAFEEIDYLFGPGLAASISSRFQLKVEFQDLYKTRPTGVLVDKNDIAFLTAVVYKF